MYLQTDSVTNPMCEVFPKSGVFNDRARRMIDLVGTCPGRIALMAAVCALSTSLYKRSSLGGILPVAIRRVKSLW